MKYATLMAKALGQKLKEPAYVVLYGGDGFAYTELRVGETSSFYHDGYLADLQDADIRRIRARLILNDIEKQRGIKHENMASKKVDSDRVVQKRK
jgi:hypothetical protein